MDKETLNLYKKLIKDFAEKEIAPMLEVPGRDGDLSKLPSIITTAEEIGLFHEENGLWGTETLKAPTVCLDILEQLSEVCAGVATCIHSRAIKNLTDGASACLKGIVVDTDHPTKIALLQFDKITIADAELEELIPRTGLGSPKIYRAKITQTHHNIEGATPYKAYLLGLCAIACGNAKGAIKKAYRYASERVQGGTEIKNHPAVKELLGRASAIYMLCRNALRDCFSRFNEITEEEILSMWAMVRELAVEAVSSALQVFGGYGYMEDYRMEKRLRDAMTLRGLPPSPLKTRIKIAENTGDKPW